MTAMVPTLVEHQTDLFRAISRLLDQYPAGSAFRLMYTPHDLDLTPDEVLVQSDLLDRLRTVRQCVSSAANVPRSSLAKAPFLSRSWASS
ncbi:hypothetical protein GCM10010306_090420 [Streptomyces umbrinus]|nr:hypothetical protein GCM10010306_090420 [Streptomyces umbrinus]